MLVDVNITNQIIGSFFVVYNEIGYGYSENICANGLAVELRSRGIPVAREVPIEVVYKGVPIGRFRLDFVVQDRVVVEIKSSKAITEADRHQIQSYLKATAFEVGLILHFGPTPSHERLIYTNDRKAKTSDPLDPCHP